MSDAPRAAAGAGKKLRIAILCGGRSAEHEISLLSARFVLESLDPERFTPVLVGIDKSGRWHLQEAALLLHGSRDPRLLELARDKPGVFLPAEPGGMLVPVAGGSVAPDGAPLGVDVVFPVLHGPLGEDGTVQGLFELAGVPYVGSRVLGSAVGMDKDVMKRLLREANLPVLPFIALRRARWEKARAALLEELGALALPLFVKPANLGSSVGVSKVRDRAALEAAIEHALGFDDKVVVEAGLENPRELECAVLGGDELLVSVPGEIVVSHADGFYSYAAKYLDETGAVTRIPAELSPGQVEHARDLARQVFVALEADDLARVDLFLDAQGRFWVNEINTMPGFTAISMFPKLMQASGLDARELVTRLIDAALNRARWKQARRA